MIVAFSFNSRVIGKNGTIPWNIPEDKKHFKSLTTGNAVIFGRKTFESIGKALPERMNYVVSSTKSYKGENLKTVSSIKNAIKDAEEKGFNKIFIAGGQKIYEEGINYADILYLTEVKKAFNGDGFFPVFDEKCFTELERLETSECVFRTLKRLPQ